MIHIGRNTKSTIISKGISAGQGQNSYRGQVKVLPKAEGARNYTQCDSMLIGNDGPQASEATAFLGVIDDVQLWRVALSQQDFCTAADLGC